MNRINYSYWTFDDSSIVSGNLAMSNAMMFDSLNPDELTVEVVSNDTGKRKLLTVEMDWYTTVDNRGYVVMTHDLRQFTYGDPVVYYYDNVLVGRYYIRSVDRLSVNHFRIKAISAVGMWANIQHFGGIYDGDTVGDVVADLLTGFSYTIDNDVASVPLYGYLPIASVRDNLQQVLFAVGASLMKDYSGNPRIQFLTGISPISVADDRIYIGGKLTYKTPSTSVRITEHSYYISPYDIEVSLFDNTDGSGTATNKLVTFDEPCHNLVATGLTLGASGSNYAYVTGTGTLTGKKYTHTTKIFSVPTGVSGEPNEAKVEKATLVSPVNSANVAARVSDYQSTAEEVACGIVLEDDGIKCGSLISFNDPYGDPAQGFVSQMNLTMSGKSKADCTVVKGYTPAHFGNNFNNVKEFSASGSWSVPSDITSIRIVLGQGGQAGQNGYNGGNSYSGTFHEWTNIPGEGGSAGSGGSGGKVFVTDILNPSGTITFTVGAGGSVGSGEGTIGNTGGHTTAVVNGTTYTSNNGAIPEEGYADIMTGKVYAAKGIDGITGGNGGEQQKSGGSVSYNGTTWVGGSVGAGTSNSHGRAEGGAGGGAAYGSKGGNGGNWQTTPRGYLRGGDGGSGANASVLPIVSLLGCGGAGGCGGGGGGCAGYWSDDRSADGSGFGGGDGVGGAYSNGVVGGSGFVLIYY